MAVEVVPQSPVQKVVAFYHDVVAEMKRVTWPDVPQVRQLSIGVVVALPVHRGRDCADGRGVPAVAGAPSLGVLGDFRVASVLRDPDDLWAREQGAVADPAQIDADPAAARGACHPAGAGADAGSRRDQERQEGHRRAEAVPGLRAGGDGGERRTRSTRSTASRASSSSSGKDRDPQPLRDDEVRRLLGIADEAEAAPPKEEIPFLVGQAVAITDGPFSDFNGMVEEVMPDKGKVRVSVSPVRAADVRGAGLPAVAGALGGAPTAARSPHRAGRLPPHE